MKRKRLEQIKDPGLRLAVEAAGGSTYALAKKLKLTPTSVLNWKRVPFSRILQVERATGVDRRKLRPDLYRSRHFNDE